ncbi:MAG: lysylphosphatidylglycerol synthase domain-containing protein, partial [Gaiella sp.]
MNVDQVIGFLGGAAARFGELDGRFLLGALALQLAILGCRAVAWRNVLAAAYPGQRVGVVDVGCAYAAGVAVNAFTPARAGEAVKVALVRTRVEGSSVPTIAASLSVILVLDALIGLGLLATFAGTGAVPGLPAPGSFGLIGLGAVAGVALAVAVVAHFQRARVAGLVRRLARGLAVLRSPRRYLVTVVPFQLAAWGCRIGVVFLVLQAFRIEAGLGTALLVVVLAGASTVVPVPGGAGSQQALAVIALQGVVSTAGAVSFSVGMQVGVTAINVLVGIAATMLVLRTTRPLAA